MSWLDDVFAKIMQSRVDRVPFKRRLEVSFANVWLTDLCSGKVLTMAFILRTAQLFWLRLKLLITLFAGTQIARVEAN